jgi:transmembrane sensor
MTPLEDDNQAAASQALAIRSQASGWVIARRASGGWTDHDQAALDTWLAESSANRLAYWRLDAAWSQTQRLSALHRPVAENLKPARMSKMLGAMIALIAVAVLGVVGAQYIRPSADKIYETPVGGRLTVALADGSKIELNTDTVLHLPGGAAARDATLEKGEAFFQIKHDANRPFELSVSGHRITDLGTKFSVHKDSGRIEVALIEGKAKIESDAPDATRRAAVLRPGDVAIATPGSLTVFKKTVADLGNALAWRHDMLTFKYATLGEAANEFNRYNRTKIIIADSRTAKLTVYGSFPTKDVAAFADAIQVSFKLHVENLNGEVVISR